MHGTSLIAEFAGYRTIADSLSHRNLHTPDAVAVRMLRAGEVNVEITVRDLEAKVQALANGLVNLTACGDRALLLFKAGPEFVTAFLACQRAGVVAVPVRLPTGRESHARILSIVSDCDPSAILTQADARDSIASYQFARPVYEIDRLSPASGDIGRDRRTDLALLQYTAGTTGTPKGVMISHKSID